MRIASIAMFGAIAAALLACSPAKPPEGRWEGTFESADTLMAARLEIEKDGTIYLTAPDALSVSSDPDQRALVKERLAEGLEQSWPSVEPRRFDFDGQVFRKPGGVAPQLEWDAGQQRMTVVVYPGNQPTLRIALHKVGAFSANPWPQ